MAIQLKFGSTKSRFIGLCDSCPHLQLRQFKKRIQKPSLDW